MKKKWAMLILTIFLSFSLVATGCGRRSASAVSDVSVAPGPGDPAAGRKVFEKKCISCHAIQGKGSSTGPALDGVANRVTEDYMRRWIPNPRSIKPEATMNPKVNQKEINDVVAYLLTLK